jgi:phage terminase small subunit
MSAMKLTARQEKFCQGIADGLNQTDAYRTAYNAVNISNKSLWERASRLAAKSKVEARINELKESLTKKYLWTREMSTQILGSIALKVSAFDNNRIAAIRELNLMNGFNAANGDLDSYVLPVRIIREPVDGRKVPGK